MSADKTTTYTLRLSELWKRRLERSAENRGESINQLVMNIIAAHYEAIGFHDKNLIQLKNGRALELRISPVEQHPPGMPSCWFYLDDPSRNREVACYEIGASNQLMRHFDVRRDDEYEVVSELGTALLHHHIGRGADITKLEWQQLPTRPDMRILDTNDIKTIYGKFLISQTDFHKSLAQVGLWRDRHLKAPFKPIVPKTIALTLQEEAQKQYDEQIASLTDRRAVTQLTKERDDVLNLIESLVPEHLLRLGAGDPMLNDNEVHVFSERWKSGHPYLPDNRVILEFGTSQTVDQAIANFVYGWINYYLDSGQPYICRWLENGVEVERPLIAQ